MNRHARPLSAAVTGAVLLVLVACSPAPAAPVESETAAEIAAATPTPTPAAMPPLSRSSTCEEFQEHATALALGEITAVLPDIESVEQLDYAMQWCLPADYASIGELLDSNDMRFKSMAIPETLTVEGDGQYAGYQMAVSVSGIFYMMSEPTPATKLGETIIDSRFFGEIKLTNLTPGRVFPSAGGGQLMLLAGYPLSSPVCAIESVNMGSDVCWIETAMAYFKYDIPEGESVYAEVEPTGRATAVVADSEAEAMNEALNNDVEVMALAYNQSGSWMVQPHKFGGTCKASNMNAYEPNVLMTSPAGENQRFCP